MDLPGILALVPGATFQGRYRIVRALSAGGMGTVYQAIDEKTAGPRALKLMHPSLLADEDLRRRFAQEARVTGGIQSDHIVRVYDAGVDEPTGAPFLVMELLDGDPLSRVVQKRGSVSAEDTLIYLGQAARALDKTHAAGIVHRDLKPDNFMLTLRDDGSPCVKILDFGIAKISHQGSRDKTTQTMGTPIYMAPEQIRGDGTIGGAADIYALAHIAYELLTGEAYFEEEFSKTAAVYAFFTTVLAGPKETPCKRAERRLKMVLPAKFDGWFAKATAADAKKRFATASEAIEQLAEVLRTPIEGARRAPVTVAEAPTAVLSEAATQIFSRSARWRRLRNRWLMGVGAAVLLISGLAAGFGSRFVGSGGTGTVAVPDAATALPATPPGPEVSPAATSLASSTVTVIPSAAMSATALPTSSAAAPKGSAKPAPTASQRKPHGIF